MSISIVVSMLLALTPIEQIEKEAKKGKQWLLVPDKVSGYGYYDGVKVFAAPAGRQTMEVPRGLLVWVVKRQKGWAKIVITMPWYARGWVKESSLGQVISENTLFYGSPDKKSGVMGYLRQGVVVKSMKPRGGFAEVVLHHHVPLKVYVPISKVGIKFGKYKNVSYSYYSRWQRNLYEVDKGRIYLSDKRKKLVGVLTEKAKMKVERYSGKWALVASPSDYDIKFKGWVEKKRIGKRPYYYYSYRNSFRINSVATTSWLQGRYKLATDKAGFVSSSASVPFIYIKKGTPVNYFKKVGSGIFMAVFSRKNYGTAPSLTGLLDSFENSTWATYYFSNYDKAYEIKVYLYMGFEDIEPNKR